MYLSVELFFLKLETLPMNSFITIGLKDVNLKTNKKHSKCQQFKAKKQFTAPNG